MNQVLVGAYVLLFQPHKNLNSPSTLNNFSGTCAQWAEIHSWRLDCHRRCSAVVMVKVIVKKHRKLSMHRRFPMKQ